MLTSVHNESRFMFYKFQFPEDAPIFVFHTIKPKIVEDFTVKKKKTKNSHSKS